MLRTAPRPPPYLIVGWSVRLATRSSHSEAAAAKCTQTAPFGLKARPRKDWRSALTTFVRSRISLFWGSLAIGPMARSNSSRPESSSWQTRCQLLLDFTSCSANVLFPQPGRPMSRTSAGLLTFGFHSIAGAAAGCAGAGSAAVDGSDAEADSVSTITCLSSSLSIFCSSCSSAPSSAQCSSPWSTACFASAGCFKRRKALARPR
mmetsp:Transcript_60195/g.140685  ORF Transcript_60195/g.140685 Transcript_60195/m.140685 type:complete len:205 (+) Transcript_60195:938-1552(+)